MGACVRIEEVICLRRPKHADSPPSILWNMGKPRMKLDESIKTSEPEVDEVILLPNFRFALRTPIDRVKIGPPS